MTDQSGMDKPASAGACMVVEAFLDGERVDPEALKRALAEPHARDHLVELLALRETVWSMTPSTWAPIARPGRARARWLAAAAAVVVSLTAGYLAGQQRVAPATTSLSPSVEAVIHVPDSPAAPAPTRVISLQPGVNWTESRRGQ
jgi:hypothetical protein